MKKQRKVPALLILLGIVLLGFGVYNCIWYNVVQHKYDPYTVDMRELYPGTHVLDGDNGYNYNVKFPDYLSYTGNLGVQTYNGVFALIIWPGIGKETTYGVRLPAEEGTEVWGIMLDYQHRALTSDPAELALVDQYQAQIDDLFKMASTQWDIL
ncbi:MAG: hypothetical protein LBG99_08495 [Propionibacteriaceae bacterium]|jgi:hypothetical protein|nr:hypothetical protein [Propionibacteriaceae bacterium]